MIVCDFIFFRKGRFYFIPYNIATLDFSISFFNTSYIKYFNSLIELTSSRSISRNPSFIIFFLMEKNSFSISDLYLTVSISDLFILFRKSRISDTLSLTAEICVSINSIFLLFVSICCFISLYEVIKANRFWLLNVINKEQVRKLKITTTILMYNNLSNLFPSSYNLSTILLTFKGDIDRLYHAFIF
ncbi:hypothetical protein HMPREF1603_01321 [Escherichia coli 907892]|nr:hypothetical protein HMPREF1603_01321 [Escherichia coli 907892]